MHDPHDVVDSAGRYGFIMYHNYDDAENCIRAFYFLGYEAKFAKVSIHYECAWCQSSQIHQESHNQRLKALSDENNTNLYVSNLPRLMVEAVSPYHPWASRSFQC